MQEPENWLARRNFYAHRNPPQNAPQPGLLPVCANCIAKMQNFSYNPRPASWKAGTLPLSYSRAKQSFCSLSTQLCQKGVTDVMTVTPVK